MSNPKFVKFQGETCMVIAWLDATVCFRYQGRDLWRDQSAVEVVEE